MNNTNFDDVFGAAMTRRLSLIDLNKTPTDSDTEEESQNPHCSEPMVNDEEKVEDSHRRIFPQQNHGASMSSSSLVDLSKIPTNSETEEDSQNDLVGRKRNFENLNGASTSKPFLNHDCFEPSSSNPNDKSSPSCKKAKIASFLCMARETPKWLVQVVRDMNGAQDLRLIFERNLSASDVNKSQSRLLIPFSMLLRNDFLTLEEVLAVAKDEDNDEDDENIGLGSILVNQRSEKWGLRFKVWEMKKKNSVNGTFNYILNWGWNDVVEGNGLREGDAISLWSFRWRGVLCFVLGKE